MTEEVSTLDHVSYSGSDSGCKVATEHLGYQSSCLSCPFSQCTQEGRDTYSFYQKFFRNKEIISMFYSGKTQKEIAEHFNLSKRTVWRVVRDYNKNNPLR